MKQRSRNRTAYDIEIARIKREAVREASQTAFSLLMGIPAMVLGDKYGWSKDEIREFLKRAYTLYVDFEQQRLTLGDIHKILLEDYEIIITQIED